MEPVKRAGDALVQEIERAIVGKTAKIRLVLCALFAGGHVLLEDVPGTAKTLLAKSLARTIGGRFRRLQGTPDLLPGDVTGSSIYDPSKAEFRFQPGPVFTNVLLADELNRATPRAQSALLECMGERQVSVEGVTRPLEPPFFVIATQNPVEQEGTFPLPEAQLDRFIMRLSIGYPGEAAEIEMLDRVGRGDPLGAVRPVLDPAKLVAIQRAIRKVHVAESVRAYIVRVAAATRASKDLILGAGPRGSLALYRCGQAWAALHGRDHVLPDDVKRLVPSVLVHRVILGADGRLGGVTAERAVESAIRLVPAPAGQ